MTKTLPKEITSLIHHITLNEQGWWDKTIQRLIISAISSVENKQMTISAILAYIHSNYETHLEVGRVEKQLEKLCSNKSIIRLSSDNYLLSESELNSFRTDIEKFEEFESRIQTHFEEIITKKCNSDEQSKITWEAFNTELLIPILYEFGAKTYELITGNGIKLESYHRFKRFLLRFPSDRHVIIKDAIINFLNPQNPLIRDYILRKLNAYFFLEAVKLPPYAVDKINLASKKQITFKVFVDTNFLFSFLSLHENPSNEAAQTLLDIISRVSNKVKIKLYIAPLTIEETKKVLINEEHKLKNLRLTKILSNVAVNHLSNGFAKKYFEECSRQGKSINASEYFEPYLNNLVKVLREKGVEIYNDSKFENYTTDQRVIDDIVDQQKIEDKAYKKAPHLKKSYEKLEHDFVLWHFVNDLRPNYVESADEAGSFITTVDFRFINFDIIKRRKKRQRVPVCIHPTNLIQILQLWIPRDENLDIAVLSNLRFPFLFTEFDADTELTTIRIIEQLSRYENINDLQEDTVTSILFNQALRQKIQKNEDKSNDIVLVKDAIIEEVKEQKQIVQTKTKQIEELDEKVKEKNFLMSNLVTEKKETESKNTMLEQRMEQLENEKKLEVQFYQDKESWSSKKELHLLKKWDNLPKWKWYLPVFFIIVIAVLVGILTLYHYFHLEAYFSMTVSIILFVFGTILLSFFNRERLIQSFLYNFRTEKFRKKKLSEFESEFITQNPEPKRIDYTTYK